MQKVGDEKPVLICLLALDSDTRSSPVLKRDPVRAINPNSNDSRPLIDVV